MTMPQRRMMDFDPKRHDRFVDEIRQWIFGYGFKSEQLPEPPTEIRKRNSPTSLSRRHIPDIFAYHTIHECELWLDAKTDDRSRSSGNFSMELAPLLFARSRSMDCADTLFCCQSVHWDVGFWSSDVPPIRSIFIPKEWDAYPVIMGWYKEQCMKLLNGVSIDDQYLGRKGGSGTPFIVVNMDDMQRLTNWRDCVRERLKKKDQNNDWDTRIV